MKYAVTRRGSGLMKDGKIGIIITTEWAIIQVRFSKADDTMKLHTKEHLRKIAYPETTCLKPSSELVKTKGELKKSKTTQDDNTTKQSPSYFKHVISHFSDSPTFKSKKKIYNGARISKPPPSLSKSKIIFIDEMSFLCTNIFSGL